jgi:hypothetical protein
VNYQEAVWPAPKLLRRMTHCTDVLPCIYCDELEMPARSTYAAAPQRLLRQVR